ncbi:hypothetical protein BDA99DRAFT_499937 [Phascolomyces articulosus]|uniref:BZIP domain-containing protein n=1 Tax=Phascolomyces articulosus TaxID=60185 RepID=A0AAD5K8A3_9FUNG|nr:hypothetical protein BDA99DRAFT_499937 [Phascolomyces articulosus]
MDNNNDNFFNWIIDQEVLNTSQQQQQQQEQTTSPGINTGLSPDQQCINNLLFHDWSDIHSSTTPLGNNPIQLSGSSSTTSTSSNESVKEQPTIRKQQQTQRSSTGTLKPFNPHGSTTDDATDNKLQPTTGRLDFRVSNNDDCQVTDSQLKKMTSKERRQLRNKISARNFRQRRKDYITSLEEQIEQLQNEKSQLKLEVKNVYGIVTKLQKENDQLRVDLLLSRQGMVTTTPTTSTSTVNHTVQQQHQQPINNNTTNATTTPDDMLASIPELTFTNTMSSPEDALFDTLDTDFHSNTSTSLSPPSSTDEMNNAASWDLVLPDATWLSHAAIPRWDWSRILDKSQARTNPTTLYDVRDTFQKYPLLAPALMSIVVGHTMSMSAEELMKTTAALIPLSNTVQQEEDDDARTLVSTSFDVKQQGVVSKTQSELTHELLQELFKASLQPTTIASITEKGEEKETVDQEEEQENEKTEGEKAKTTYKPCCPSQYIIPLFRSYACKVVTEFYNCVQQMDNCRKQLCPIQKYEQLTASSSSSSSSSTTTPRQQPLSSC